MGESTGLDAILTELGPFGKYNVVNFALLLFPIYLSGMYGSVFVFEAPDINYRCNISECEHLNSTIWVDHAIPKEKGNLMRCKRYGFSSNNSGTCETGDFNTSKILDCDEFVYSDKDSAVKDFNLGCQHWKRTLIGTIHYTGIILSLPITGMISDKYGRKLTLSIASFLKGTFGVLRSFSPNYFVFNALEFMEAVAGVGTYNTAFVIAIELVGPKGRVFGNSLITTVYVLGVMTASGLAWWLQSWRNFLRVIYTPALLVLSYYWILNESIRWLMSKGRHQEATTILKKAAKMNKVELSEELLAPLYEFDKLHIIYRRKDNGTISDEMNQNKESSNFARVFKSSIMRTRLFVCSFLWITCSFVYYGLSINSVSLAGNMYVNFMLVAFVEIPANFMCLLLDRFGRKKVLVNTYVLNACLCISLSLLPKDQKWWALFLYLSGKFSITVAYNTVYIYVSEAFPTNVRQSMLAVCASIGRVGSATAPLTPLMALYYANLPAMFFGSMALVASLLVLKLPETKNVTLPDTIEEAEAFSQKK